MITSVQLFGLRGIREGTIEGLDRLAVLVGANGSGKSTLLEALLIGGYPDPGMGLERVLRGRRAQARWLFHRAEPAASRILIRTTGGERTCIIEPHPNERGLLDEIQCVVPLGPDVTWKVTTRITESNQTIERSYSGPPLPSLGQIRWIAPCSPFQAPLHEVYSEVVRQGRRPASKKLLEAVIPGFQDIEILTEADIPIVHIVFEDHSLPVSVMGDGVQSLVRLALELAARPGGLALVEEPEAHQHPRALKQSVRAILEATRRDVQVVVSTHSLELVDALLAIADQSDLDHLAVYRFALQEGVLRTTRIPGSDAALARGQIGDDLR